MDGAEFFGCSRDSIQFFECTVTSKLPGGPGTPECPFPQWVYANNTQRNILFYLFNNAII